MAGHSFVTVSTAMELLSKTIRPGTIVEIPPEDASGFVLARSVRAALHSPPFSQSAMDGYAFRIGDADRGKLLTVSGMVKAGTPFRGRLGRGEAVRIYTGGCIPAGADTVIMQEKTSVRNNLLSMNDPAIIKGANIRLQGSQLRKGMIAAHAGMLISPGTAGLLLSLGVKRIQVYRKPTLGIIVTGDELVLPGKPLRDGAVYESNAGMLRAALRNEGIIDPVVVRVKDRFNDIKSAFDRMIKKCDIVLFTGGISVGDYDFTGDAVARAGVRTVFYKVKQKPGKPLYFGKLNRKYVFGLPGNPASVLTCFYMYVVPALRMFQKSPNPFLPILHLPVRQPVSKKPGLAVFLKARATAGGVDLLPGQESYKLQPFNNANGFIVFDESSEGCPENTIVPVHLFGGLHT